MIMARKPAHWMLRMALGLALSAISSTLIAEDHPTLAKPPADGAGSYFKPAVGRSEASPPVIGGPAEAAPLTSEASAESTADESENTANEVIRERHANSAVKVERHVTQDAEGNYYNHGLWTQWDEKSRLVGSGEYRYGKRQGRWLRWYVQGDVPMLGGALYKDF